MSMRKNILFWSGIIGVCLFVLTTIASGYFYPNYHHSSQFISELYAVDAPNANLIRYGGYLPSGLLFLLFSFFGMREKPQSKTKTLGFLGIGFGYGFGTVICSIFNCDAGCNPEFINPSLSQIIHNLMGLLTYLIVPVSIFIITLDVKQNKRFFKYSFLLAALSFIFMILLNLSLQSHYKGLIQRVIEGCILCWIVLYSVYASKSNKAI
jgi:hypothetical membrane protein